MNNKNNFTKNVIAEATTLNKNELEITDEKKIRKLIKMYDDGATGKKQVKRKNGKVLSKKYCAEKRRLFKKKLAELTQNKQTSKQTSEPVNDNADVISRSALIQSFNKLTDKEKEVFKNVFSQWKILFKTQENSEKN